MLILVAETLKTIMMPPQPKMMMTKVISTNFPSPRPINFPATTYINVGLYLCQSTSNMVVNYMASSNFQWKYFSWYHKLMASTPMYCNKSHSTNMSIRARARCGILTPKIIIGRIRLALIFFMPIT